MKERFNTITEFQAVANWWESKIIPEEGLTPASRFLRTVEEFQELGEAIEELDGSPEKCREAGLEIADIFILGASIATALGQNLEELIYHKIERNHHKYNVEEAKSLRENGMEWQDTLTHLKNKWG